MDCFHVVVDTSMLRQMHFQHPDFERLLLRSRKGLLKIYIPHIVLEEERTFLLASRISCQASTQTPRPPTSDSFFKATRTTT